MFNLDDELAEEYLAECREHLARVRMCLPEIEAHGPEIHEEAVDRVFRAVHSIKEGAGFFELARIRELAQRTEDVLALIRSRKIIPTRERVRVLLRATERMDYLIEDAGMSNQVDTGEIVAELAGLCVAPAAAPEKGGASAVFRTDPGGRGLRVLLVDDDFASRLILQSFLSRHGECHIAVNGKEAVAAFRSALDTGVRYDLICMDIMMPEMDGLEAVGQVRAIEEQNGISSTYGARIIMTTAVDDLKEVSRCFTALCDAYLVKPIDLGELLKQMKSFHLVR